MNCLTALAYHFYLALPAAFTQPGADLVAELCTFIAKLIILMVRVCAVTRSQTPYGNNTLKRFPGTENSFSIIGPLG